MRRRHTSRDIFFYSTISPPLSPYIYESPCSLFILFWSSICSTLRFPHTFISLWTLFSTPSFIELDRELEENCPPTYDKLPARVFFSSDPVVDLWYTYIRVYIRRASWKNKIFCFVFASYRRGYHKGRKFVNLDRLE